MRGLHACLAICLPACLPPLTCRHHPWPTPRPRPAGAAPAGARVHLPLSDCAPCPLTCRALQVLPQPDRVSICAELTEATLRCVRDQNGNHVVQKCIECVQPSDPARQMIEVSFLCCWLRRLESGKELRHMSALVAQKKAGIPAETVAGTGN